MSASDLIDRAVPGGDLPANAVRNRVVSRARAGIASDCWVNEPAPTAVRGSQAPLAPPQLHDLPASVQVLDLHQSYSTPIH